MDAPDRLAHGVTRHRSDVTKQLDELIDAERKGKFFLAELPAESTDSRAITYGLATVLLGAAGRSSFDVSGNPAYTRALWYPVYDEARRLGSPSGPHAVDPNGVYRRDFAGGTVLVNPTTATHAVSLGALHSGSGLSNVSTVTIGSTSGLVLLEAG